MVRTRFAPSPTGDLHLGGAWTALAAWAFARAAGGQAVLRVEDIDTPRVVRGATARIEEDLAWLGLDWDEGPREGGIHASYTQSERAPFYDAKLSALTAAGLTYECDCSRAEISRAASAPHAGEEVVYPGTCRDAPSGRELKRAPAIRLKVPEGASVVFDDMVRGRIEQHVASSVGDFVLRRGDGIYAYQLVVAADDAAMEISHVIRADDLLASTARQILLMQLLGTAPHGIPTYAHVPMVVAPDGERLAKRAGSASVRALRERGVPRDEIVATLARGLGLCPGEAEGAASSHRMTPTELAAVLEPPRAWRREPWPIPAAWA